MPWFFSDAFEEAANRSDSPPSQEQESRILRVFATLFAVTLSAPA